jgi:hypothetical protein
LKRSKLGKVKDEIKNLDGIELNKIELQVEAVSTLNKQNFQMQKIIKGLT